MTTHYVYEFYDVNDNPMYVGCTGRLGKRITSHLGKSWWPEVARMSAVAYADRESGVEAEAKRIAELQPIHNTVHTIREAENTRRQVETRRANQLERHRRGLCAFLCPSCAEDRRGGRAS